MSTFRAKIDEKSLFYGLTNDYEKGQTATVATPINQSKFKEKWHHDIINFSECGVAEKNIPNDLYRLCISKSKSPSRITCFMRFKNLLIDGKPLGCRYSFAMYIKEETAKFIRNKFHQLVPNTHLHRLKLHYPITFEYKKHGYNINNLEVLKQITHQNGNSAFLVNAFEYDTESETLNFITTPVGPLDIPLSQVFIQKKGTGEKLINHIKPTIATIMGETIEISPNASREEDEETGDTRYRNGVMGEEYVYEHIKELIGDYVNEVNHVSRTYPTSPYDIDYVENGIKKYVEVKATSSDKERFYMSLYEINFMESKKDDYVLFMITKVGTPEQKIKKYTYNDIKNMRQVAPPTRITFYPS